MRARIVHESMYGNTAAIAAAIAVGLGEYFSVETVTVAEAQPNRLCPRSICSSSGDPPTRSASADRSLGKTPPNAPRLR